ncbi:403_t:CDS:1, partial [Paraglomus brasilianum]
LDKEQYRHQQFYPHPRQYISENGPVQFNYESCLTGDQEKLVFKAKAGDTPLVVKFTQRYNADAHRLCANNGFAPKLLYIGENEVRGWKIIVMEHIDGPTLYMAKLNREYYGALLADIREAVQKLHEQDIVFGDLRGTNIIINEASRKHCAMLVDFDWAGSHHKDCYPYGINPEIKWAPGVEG